MSTPPSDALASAIRRMDLARAILTDNNPRHECNWGMLDTSDLREAIGTAQHKTCQTADEFWKAMAEWRKSQPVAAPGVFMDDNSEPLV